MSLLKDLHTKFLSSFKTLSLLKKGIVPNASAISVNSGVPLTPEKFPLSNNSALSSSKYLESIENINKDIEFGEFILGEVNKRIALSRNIHSYSLDQLKRYILNLQEQLNNLYLSSSLDGYTDSVFDIFVDTSKIDLPQTDAFIDLSSTIVSIPYLGNFQKLNLGNFNISVKALTPVNLVSSFSTPNSTASNILDSSDSVFFAGFNYTTNTQPVSCQLELTLENKQYFNKVSVVSLSANTSVKTLAFCEYFDYALNSWQSFTLDGEYKDISYSNCWIDQTVQTDKLRLTLTKNAEDYISSKKYFTYTFQLKSLSLYNLEYKTSSATLISNELLLDKDFSSLSLDVCESLLPNTSIDYFVKCGKDNVWQNDWTKISPLSRKSGNSVVSLSNPSLISYRNITLIDKLDSGADYFRLTDLDGVYALDLPDLSNLDTESSFVFRNCISLDNIYNGSYYINNNPRGWVSDGDYYTANYYNFDTEFALDFGPNKIILNDKEVSGLVLIPSGLSLIKIAKQFFIDLTINGQPLGPIVSFDPINKSFTDNDGKVIVDNLWPYNPKFLLERMPYAASFDNRNAVYLKRNQSISLGQKIDFKPLESFIYSKDINSFSLSPGVIPVIVVYDLMTNVSFLTDAQKRDLGGEGYVPSNAELFDVFVSHPSSGTNLKKANKVLFKAVFSTNDPSISPSLDNYKIKVR